MAYSPDGRQLATASDDNTVKLSDALTATLDGHTGDVPSVAYL